LEKNLDAALNGVLAAYLERADRNGALDYFQRLLEKFPKNKKLIWHIAKMEKENGNVEGVLRLTRNLLDLDVKDTEGHLWMAWALEQKGDIKEAGLAYMRAVESDPKNEEAYRGLLAMYRLQGRLSELVPYFERKSEKFTDNETLAKALEEAKSGN
jgi:tetratricopeptide (TPR) repeat protein